jgi:hypothetical protein
MLKRFKTKELIVIALVGALLFLIEFLISSVISKVLGLPAVGFLVVIIFWTAIALLGGIIIKKIGTFTLMALIYSLLAIPTEVFGPPGIYKIVPAVLVGGLIDLFVYLFRYKKWAYYIGCSLGQLIGLFLFIAAYFLLGFPGKEEMIASLWFLIASYGGLALIGAWLGFIIFNKIKNKTIIKQLRD